MSLSSFDRKAVRKVFSRIGIALCTILVIATILQVIWFAIPIAIWGEENPISSSSWNMWVGTFVPLYVVAIPLGLLIMRRLPAQAPSEQKLEMRYFLPFIPMCICVMYGGNLLGTMLSSVLSGGTAENMILDYVMDSNPLKILAVVILAPLLEEFVCRKQIIDRTRQYGEKCAVFLSAFVFGLLHQNLFQFFYAFGLGLIFAYIYIRTGRLRYPVLLHAFVNFLGSVVAPWLLSNIDITVIENMDPTASLEEIIPLISPMLPGFLMYMAYTFALVGLSIWGAILLVRRCEKLIWKEAENPIPKGSVFRTVYLNVGMILYILICAVSFIFALTY